jgi:hypothetical protein
MGLLAVGWGRDSDLASSLDPHASEVIDYLHGYLEETDDAGAVLPALDLEGLIFHRLDATTGIYSERHFEDVVEVAVGWLADGAVAGQDVPLMADRLAVFGACWEQHPDFAESLVGNLFRDIAAAENDDEVASGSDGNGNGGGAEFLRNALLTIVIAAGDPLNRLGEAAVVLFAGALPDMSATIRRSAGNVHHGGGGGGGVGVAEARRAAEAAMLIGRAAPAEFIAHSHHLAGALLLHATVGTTEERVAWLGLVDEAMGVMRWEPPPACVDVLLAETSALWASRASSDRRLVSAALTALYRLADSADDAVVSRVYRAAAEGMERSAAAVSAASAVDSHSSTDDETSANNSNSATLPARAVREAVFCLAVVARVAGTPAATRQFPLVDELVLGTAFAAARVSPVIHRAALRALESYSSNPAVRTGDVGSVGGVGGVSGGGGGDVNRSGNSSELGVVRCVNAMLAAVCDQRTQHVDLAADSATLLQCLRWVEREANLCRLERATEPVASAAVATAAQRQERVLRFVDRAVHGTVRHAAHLDPRVRRAVGQCLSALAAVGTGGAGRTVAEVALSRLCDVDVQARRAFEDAVLRGPAGALRRAIPLLLSALFDA